MTPRENPFSSDRVLRVRYRMEPEAWTVLLARFEASGHRGALVGPEGSGKTTLLEDLAPRLEQRGWRVLLVRGQEALALHPGPRDCVLLDSAELLTGVQWLRFRWQARRAGGMLITAHRRGRLPTLLQCSTNPEILAWMLTELMGECEDWPQLAAQLWERHRGNLREALREMYDRCAGPGGMRR